MQKDCKLCPLYHCGDCGDSQVWERAGRGAQARISSAETMLDKLCSSCNNVASVAFSLQACSCFEAARWLRVWKRDKR